MNRFDKLRGMHITHTAPHVTRAMVDEMQETQRKVDALEQKLAGMASEALEENPPLFSIYHGQHVVHIWKDQVSYEGGYPQHEDALALTMRGIDFMMNEARK